MSKKKQQQKVSGYVIAIDKEADVRTVRVRVKETGHEHNGKRMSVLHGEEILGLEKGVNVRFLIVAKDVPSENAAGWEPRNFASHLELVTASSTETSKTSEEDLYSDEKCNIGFHWDQQVSLIEVRIIINHISDRYDMMSQKTGLGITLSGIVKDMGFVYNLNKNSIFFSNSKLFFVLFYRFGLEYFTARLATLDPGEFLKRADLRDEPVGRYFKRTICYKWARFLTSVNDLHWQEFFSHEERVFLSKTVMKDLAIPMAKLFKNIAPSQDYLIDFMNDAAEFRFPKDKESQEFWIERARDGHP